MNIIDEIMPFRLLETKKADEKSTRDLLASPVIQSKLYFSFCSLSFLYLLYMCGEGME